MPAHRGVPALSGYAVPFRDRAAAGRRLAEMLAPLLGNAVVVLALPRGGVPLAAIIARALDAPLDILVVRKIGAPGNPEYGVGAVAEGGVLFLDRVQLRELGLTPHRMEPVIRDERGEVARRASRYRCDHPPAVIEDQIAVLVDDGLATGGTMRAAVEAVRLRNPRRVVVAVGVASTEAVESLRPSVDELVCPLVPPRLASVGEWYEEFPQLSDADVRGILEREWTRGRLPPEGARRAPTRS